LEAGTDCVGVAAVALLRVVLEHADAVTIVPAEVWSGVGAVDAEVGGDEGEEFDGEILEGWHFEG